MRYKRFDTPAETASVAGEYRRLFEKAARDMFVSSPQPVLWLSGGVDSTMIALALARQHLHCDTLTITLGDLESDDLVRARQTAAQLFPQHRHHVVRIPATWEHYYAHCTEAIEFCGSATDTLIEVTWATFEAVRATVSLGYSDYLCGFGAGWHFAHTRHHKAALQKSAVEWSDMRVRSVWERLVAFPMDSARATDEYARDKRIGQRDVFLDPQLSAFALRQSYATMNCGVEKGFARVVYPELTHLRIKPRNLQSAMAIQTWAEREVVARYKCSPTRFYHALAQHLDINWQGEFEHYDKFRLRRHASIISEYRRIFSSLRALNVISFRETTGAAHQTTQE